MEVSYGSYAVMHVGIANPRWRGKRSQLSRRMRNPQIYVSCARPMTCWAQLLSNHVLICCKCGNMSQLLHIAAGCVVLPEEWVYLHEDGTLLVVKNTVNEATTCMCSCNVNITFQRKISVARHVHECFMHKTSCLIVTIRFISYTHT